MMHLVFWQPIPSFHQEGFFCALAQADWVDSVTLKYESELPESRRQSGWREAAFSGVQLELIRTDEIPADTAAHVHVFTGFQTHAHVWAAFDRIPVVAQCRRFAFAEAPECVGWVPTALRFLKYRMASWKMAPRLAGMLAMGQLGVGFYTKVLPRSVPVHPFAYYDVCEGDFPLLNGEDAANQQPAPLRSPVSDLIAPTHPYHFLYVGQLIHRKGVDRLLRALGTVRNEAWTLTVVGEGDQAEALRQQAISLGIAEKLQWHGSVPSGQLGLYYQQADCLVLPSRWDGWGMTVNEALRYGCDVLATVTCGAASALPQAAQLPEDSVVWGDFFEAQIRGGIVGKSDRIANQQRAKALSGEAGVAQLKAILSTGKS